ncbi:hypothetical protein N7489_004838 [Penicillium chrysogenum]|uniref:uncharacterized protein n=1 Tax=Penicillium chrysogenum TaxID=5076 RepID=UPI0024DF0C52|nr:uncharacterized protein N7489_004838 [Penicillium chrysogenum]KAJ5244742.1 hypothetical protein N7489_004838 [Penicillium chrysogenum]
MSDRNNTGLAKQHDTQNRQYNEEIQSPIKPSLNDTDEQITQDYKEAIDRSNILSGDAGQHAEPQSSYASKEDQDADDIPWRPDPSGNPNRTS